MLGFLNAAAARKAEHRMRGAVVAEGSADYATDVIFAFSHQGARL